MSDIFNSLYDTQDDISDSQCTGLDFLQTQTQTSLSDLNRYGKDSKTNQINLEMIKEEEIFSQMEDHQISENKLNHNDFQKRGDETNGIILNNNFNSNKFEEKIFRLSQEVDAITNENLKDASKKKPIANNIQMANNQINLNKNNYNINNNSNNSVPFFNINAKNSMISFNQPTKTNEFKIDYKKSENQNNLIKKENKQTKEKIIFKGFADNLTEKKNVSKANDNISDEELLNDARIVSDLFNEELYLKIQSITDIFLREIDTCKSKMNDILDSYKQKFLNGVNHVYLILQEEAFQTIAEEEKNKIIEKKIQTLLSEIVGLLNEIHK